MGLEKVVMIIICYDYNNTCTGFNNKTCTSVAKIVIKIQFHLVPTINSIEFKYLFSLPNHIYLHTLINAI